MWNVADGVDEGLIARIQWADRMGSPLACPRHVGPVGRQWNPCKLGDAEERAAGHERAEALLAQLGEFHALEQAHPDLSGTALAQRLQAIARRHPFADEDG
jgi:hypothetical protein